MSYGKGGFACAGTDIKHDSAATVAKEVAVGCVRWESNFKLAKNFKAISYSNNN